VVRHRDDPVESPTERRFGGMESSTFVEADELSKRAGW
jgi:hypothetical protein